MYQSIVEYRIGSLYDGKVKVSHYNNLDDGEIIARAKRLLNFKAITLGMCSERWIVISTDYIE